MKKNLLFIALLLFLSHFDYAQPAKLLFVNNTVNTSGALDIKIYNQTSGVIVDSFLNLTSVGATTQISLPPDTILTLKLFTQGTSSVVFSEPNLLLDPNTLQLFFITGSAANPSGGSSSAITTGGSTIEVDTRSALMGLPAFDLKIRGTSAVLATALTYPNLTFGATVSVNPGSYTLDLLPTGSSNGLAAYTWNATALSGQYVQLFTSGSTADPDLWMIQTTGVLTKLPHVTAISGIEDVSTTHLNLYPNPSTNEVHLTIDKSFQDAIIKVTDASGKIVSSGPVNSQLTTIT